VTGATDEQRIRKGLVFLLKTDRALLRAAVPLTRLLELPDPLPASKALRAYTFQVEGRTYRGQMTPDQDAHLRKHMGSARKFADAIAKVLGHVNDKVVRALHNLNEAPGAPPARRGGPALFDGGPPPPPPVGCCSYDTNQQADGVTQSFCEGGLLGHWVPGPC
jgi:hypothetical protein